MSGKHYAPTKRERSQLTRIYGDEKNWDGVITQPAKVRRSIKNGIQRRAKKGVK